jgi:hypothetical protein
VSRSENAAFYRKNAGFSHDDTLFIAVKERDTE